MDEHAVTRRVLGERRGHQRAVGRLLRGEGSSFATTAASHAHFAPGSLSAQPSYEQLAAAMVASKAEADHYKSKVDSMEKNIALLVAQLQSRMPDIQYPGFVPPYPQPGPNAEGDDDEEDDDDDEDLGED